MSFILMLPALYISGTATTLIVERADCLQYLGTILSQFRVVCTRNTGAEDHPVLLEVRHVVSSGPRRNRGRSVALPPSQRARTPITDGRLDQG